MRIPAHSVAALVVVLAIVPGINASELDQPATSAEVARSGWPWCYWKWAQVQNPCNYTGYYVGGGAPGPRSREHCDCEGTWGWDYQGRNFKRLVNLGWTLPTRRQGGTGSYQPDGPRVLEAAHEHIHARHADE